MNENGIDLGFIQYWDFLNSERREIINKYINPERIIPMHIPAGKVDDVSKKADKLKNEYPVITV